MTEQGRLARPSQRANVGRERPKVSTGSRKIAEQPTPRNPLFAISFRQRDEIAATAARAGWQVIAARRLDKAAQRFVLSNADIALVDARGAVEDGMSAVKAIGESAHINGSALFVLLSKKDISRAGEFLEVGATHFLASPFGEDELGYALRFAERHAERAKGESGRSAVGIGNDVEPLEWRYDPDQGRVELGDAAAQILGLKAATEMGIDTFLALFDGSASSEARQAIDSVLATAEPTAFAQERQDGSIVHHLGVRGSVIVGRLERPADTAIPRSASLRDAITGLGDSRTARQWIDEQLEHRETPASSELDVILIGLTRFDLVNAALGRDAGDEVLHVVARRIEQTMASAPSERRLLARIGGAQFILGLVGKPDAEEISRVTEQMAEAIEQPIMVEGHLLQLKARCGIATAQNDDDSASLIRRASAALAAAQKSGIATIRLDDDDGPANGANRHRLELDLARALDQDEIEIVFQPQIALEDRQIVGVEALARWRHPEFGELGAEALFSAAERSEFLIELSSHVQTKALELAAAWPRSLAQLRLSINVTAEELGIANFSTRMLEQIEKADFPPARLTFEVTESGLIGDLSDASRLLSELREAGSRIAIDDFGTGYSSLAYLKTLPLDYLKLDRKLIEGMAEDDRDKAIVGGVIELAHALGLATIAEGVESDAQLALLAKLGCEYCQGFLFSPPVNESVLVEMLRNG